MVFDPNAYTKERKEAAAAQAAEKKKKLLATQIDTIKKYIEEKFKNYGYYPFFFVENTIGSFFDDMKSELFFCIDTECYDGMSEHYKSSSRSKKELNPQKYPHIHFFSAGEQKIKIEIALNEKNKIHTQEEDYADDYSNILNDFLERYMNCLNIR